MSNRESSVLAYREPVTHLDSAPRRQHRQAGTLGGGAGMATIDDARARLVAGQAARLRDDARTGDELLRQVGLRKRVSS